jgi:hypothetical protein
VRTLALVSADGRPVEVRLIGYGDRTQSGAVHQAIAPLLEFAAGAGGRRGRALALLPVEFARERASSGMTLEGGERPLKLPAAEVARLVRWVDGGDGGIDPVVIVCGDEWERNRVAAVLARLPVEVVRATRPAEAHAALARRPALAVIAGDPVGLDRFVAAARSANVPLLEIRGADLDERRLLDEVSDLLDFV